MNWSKAKTILIIFLLLTFLLLCGMLLHSRNKSSKIQPETVKYATDLLQKQGISIDQSKIPTTIRTATIFEAENVISEYDDFARLVLPDSVKVQDNIYTSSIGTIQFDGDNFKIEYYNGIDTDKKHKSPSEKASAYLMPLGIDVSDAITYTSNNAKGLFTVIFTNTLDKLSFFDSTVSVTLKGESIVTVEGAWFTKLNTLAPVVMLDSAPGLLIKFAADTPGFRDLEITNLTLGYAINEHGVYHKQSTILPVYQITTTDNRVFLMDAR